MRRAKKRTAARASSWAKSVRASAQRFSIASGTKFTKPAVASSRLSWSSSTRCMISAAGNESRRAAPRSPRQARTRRRDPTPRVRRQRQIQAPVEGTVIQDVPVATSAVKASGSAREGRAGRTRPSSLWWAAARPRKAFNSGVDAVLHPVQLKAPAFSPLGYRDGFQVGVDAPGGEGAVEGGSEHTNLGRSRARSVLLERSSRVALRGFQAGSAPQRGGSVPPDAARR